VDLPPICRLLNLHRAFENLDRLLAGFAHAANGAETTRGAEMIVKC
jgi:hypothetical protein